MFLKVFCMRGRAPEKGYSGLQIKQKRFKQTGGPKHFVEK